MMKNVRKNGSKALAFSILGGSILSPLTVSADNVFGPIQTDKLEELEKKEGIRSATVEDLEQATKTIEEDYRLVFGSDKDGVKKGEEYLVYPAYLTLKTGELVKLDGENNPEIQDFIKKHSRVIESGATESIANLDIDAVYHIRQIKRAPGSYLNPFLSTENRRNNGFYGEGESLGFEFPVMDNGILADKQVHEIDPKDVDVDSGTNEPLVGETDIENIVGNIIVAKYGDEGKDLGHITEDNSFDKVDKGFGVDTLKGARFTIRQLKKPVETKRDFLEDITIGNSENYEGAKEAKERNKATFAEVEDNEYFAELTYNDEGTLAITGRKGEFNGLPEGVYVIDEIQPPKGYTRTNMNIEITITVAENGIDRVVMVGDGTGDRKDGEGLYLIEDKDFAKDAHSYGLKVNNYMKPGRDPEKPVIREDGIDSPLVKEVWVNGEEKTNITEGINPSKFFDYKVKFTLPEDISEYEYLEVYDNFDNSIKIDDMYIEVFSRENGGEAETEYEGVDYFVHKDGNKVKVVFAKECIKTLSGDTEITVEYKNVRFSEDLTSAEVQEIMDNGKGYVENIAKLHFVNGSGYTVNPLDPDKEPTNPDGDNPHVNPNPENPFELDKNNKPSQPEKPKESEDIRVPEVPESNVVTATPMARDFEFIKVDKAGDPLEGAEFELTYLGDGNGDDNFGKPELGEDYEEPEDEDYETPEEYKAFKDINTFSNKVRLSENSFYLNGLKLNGRKTKAISDKDGKVRFEGLPLGTYEIREVKAPNGYRLSNEPIKISFTTSTEKEDIKQKQITKIVAEYDGQKVTVEDGNLLITGDNSGLKVVNYKYNETPKTGTLGKTMYVGAGALVLTIGVLGLKKKED